jgi:hypothetical protein
MTQVLEWTEFPDLRAHTQERKRGTWGDFTEKLRRPKMFPSKEACPLLNLGVFGDSATAAHCLRDAGNLLSVTGIEGDYDAGGLSPETAVELLESAGVRAMVYTSASHTPGNPRWRVLAPLSRPISPSERAGYVARLNGVLAHFDALGDESFDLSRAYYFGRVTGGVYGSWVTFGDPDAGLCIDELTGIEPRGPVGKADKPAGEKLPHDERMAGWLATIATGANGLHNALRDMAASLVGIGMPPESVQTLLFGLMDASELNGDGRWRERRAEIPALVQSAASKYAAQGFADAVNAAAPVADRFKLLSAADLLALPAQSWRVKGVFPAAGVAAIYGASGSGKTFLALDLAVAIAAGRPWFQKRVTAAPVVYLALEGEAGIAQRIQALHKERGAGLPDGLKVVLQPVSVVTAQDVADLAAVVPRGSVVFLDTLNRAASGVDENGSEGMGKILAGAGALQRLTGGLVVLVHHSGKNAANGMRGHSSLLGAMDAVVEVERSGETRHWSDAKVKDGPDGGRYGFALRSVALGFDSDGEAVTSCVIDQQHLPVPAAKLSAQATQGLSILQALHDTNGSQHVSTDEWRAAFYAALGDAKPETKKKAFQRVCDALTGAGAVASLGGMHAPMEF